MMLEYAANSAQNVYRFLDMVTKMIVHSRDVMWLGHKFHESSKKEIMPVPEDDYEDEEEIAPSTNMRSRRDVINLPT